MQAFVMRLKQTGKGLVRYCCEGQRKLYLNLKIKKKKITFNYFVYLCVCVRTRVPWLMWRSEDNLRELVLFCLVDSGELNELRLLGLEIGSSPNKHFLSHALNLET